MADVLPIRRAAPVSNLRPIGDPRLSSSALEAVIMSLPTDRPAGLCETRWRILQCMAAHPAGLPSSAELRLYAALNAKALAEHVQGLRWKGLILFESLRLSPLGEALIRQHAGSNGAQAV